MATARLATFVAIVSTAAACGTSEGSGMLGRLAPGSGGPGGDDPSLGGGGKGDGSGGFSVGSGGSGAGSQGVGGACLELSQVAKNQIQPSDIILAIDQSGSMELETNWVKDQLGGFAQQIMASGIDVHVVVIAGPPGTEHGFCIPPPLGSGGCPADDNPPALLHVKQHVDSHDALIQILGKYPEYKQALRPDASKHVVVISDDESAVPAGEFDGKLKALGPPLFDGYVFHAIVASEDDPGGWDCAWNPQPCCGVSAGEGKVYMQLVQMTQGVFGDLCEQNFQPVWSKLSTQVIANAKIACSWDIPPPPEGEQFDPALVNVEYSVGGGPSQSIGQVPSPADCAKVSGGWYYDDPAKPTKIEVCPATCKQLQAAEDATMSVKFGCKTELATPN
ncbi:MAG: hypothetical protein HY744_26975 [Deltaproteobacteria bacterium]|nr:hypothetical protein [Deltaproteobacteria bacterium]